MATSQGIITRRPEYRLFAANAVALAAFIGSPLAGAILIAVNYVRMGKAIKGALSVILGLICTAFPILIKWNWHTLWGSLGSFALVIVFFFGTWQIAEEEKARMLNSTLRVAANRVQNRRPCSSGSRLLQFCSVCFTLLAPYIRITKWWPLEPGTR
jgi:CO/xanthine dehydrogenase Mo-binding subunit